VIEHKGLPVTGYRPTQPPEAVELVNRLKAHEQAFVELAAEVQRYVEQNAEPHYVGSSLRRLAIAQTQLEQGYMMAAKAVFMPTAGLGSPRKAEG
jgi:hypothetical protein